MNPLTQSKNTTILPVLIALTFVCVGLVLTARAVNPPPDGGHLGNNIAEGRDMLFSLTSGINNTAIGYVALFNNISRSNDTATTR